MKLILILLLTFAMSVFGQEPSVESAQSEQTDPLQLTKLESANLSLAIKDVQLAQLQIQIAAANHQTALGRRAAQQSKLDAVLAGFREAHDAPADKFTFDAVKMMFVAIPEEAEAKKK